MSPLAQLLIDKANHIRGNRKAYSLAAAGLRDNHGVHADDIATYVDQRSTGVAGIDGGVGLQIDHGSGAVELALCRTDHAQSHCVLKAERATKCKCKLTDMHLVGVRQSERRQIGGFHLEQSNIGQRVAPKNLGCKALSISNAASLPVAMAK